MVNKNNNSKSGMFGINRKRHHAFKEFSVPGGGISFIPEDIQLRIPENTTLNVDLIHFLVSIPWRESYVSNIDENYREFYLRVLPYLHARTTDVHIAICFPFIKELINKYNDTLDEQVVTIAFILHDTGWSQMNDIEIAESLGVSGLILNNTAMGPKEKHALLGKGIAEKILNNYSFEPSLTIQQKEAIYQAILYHDKPWILERNGDIPLEVKLVCDVDHLWSFTHENFWQDTVRKGVEPILYWTNLKEDLDSYFVTLEGRTLAKALLNERMDEINVWKKHVYRRSIGINRFWFMRYVKRFGH